jgi:hypothetical protein
MRTEHDVNQDLRELIERGSASWSGPGPRAGRSRWSEVAERPRRARRAVGWSAASAGFTLVILGTVLLAAVAVSPGGAASMTRIVSQAFVGSSRPTPSVDPAATPPASPTARPGPVASPTATVAVPKATAAPYREGEGRRPTPQPGASAQPSPSPSPSARPDE